MCYHNNSVSSVAGADQRRWKQWQVQTEGLANDLPSAQQRADIAVAGTTWLKTLAVSVVGTTERRAKRGGIVDDGEQEAGIITPEKWRAVWGCRRPSVQAYGVRHAWVHDRTVYLRNTRLHPSCTMRAGEQEQQWGRCWRLAGTGTGMRTWSWTDTGKEVTVHSTTI